MLGFFDVLGFSARVEHDGVEAVATLYDQLLARVDEATGPMLCLGVRRVSMNTGVPMLFKLPRGSAYFSDTILLWADLEPHFVGPFLTRCSTLICEALTMSVPLRGAVAIGQAVMEPERGIYLGAPVVEAARLEPKLGWLGAVLAESCAWPPFLAEAHPSQIMEYELPVKDPSNIHEAMPVALDWPRLWRKDRKSDLIDRLSEMAAKTRHPYYAATRKFAEYSAANADWFDRPPDPDAALRLKPLTHGLGDVASDP
jgi:hypothetical protein